MKLELTEIQRQAKKNFKTFVDQEISPFADEFDRQECIPQELIDKLAQKKYLGAMLAEEAGGLGIDWVLFGILNEEIGRGCSSVRSLLTVHSMLAFVVSRWGSPEQKARWLSSLAVGETIGAFALSEPTVGSDAQSIETTATFTGQSYILNGHKKWITFGQIAHLFLVFARCDEKLAAFLVERDRPGFTIKPITGMMGTKASMLAELHFSTCEIPKENLVGGLGFGLAMIAQSALDLGRYSVAWGAVGISQASLEASITYTQTRKQFAKPLKDHQLIRQMMTNMATNTQAARLLCYQAGFFKDIADSEATASILMAKYFASITAVQSANDAVQIHGANGCSNDYPVQRYLRDAKVMEIIEGSTQIQQIMIAKNLYR